MRILADEGVDRPIVARLRREGYEVLYVAELEPGIDDAVILDRAQQEGALLLTTERISANWCFASSVPAVACCC